MSVDPKVTEAITAAVEERGQSPALARRLLAWLQAVTSGNEDLADVSATERRLELIYADVGDEDGAEEQDDDPGADVDDGEDD